MCWAPDSRQILTYSTNNLRISIWSLISQELISYIANYKLLPPKGIIFTNNMKFVALAEKKEGRDRIGLYYAGSQWKMINSFDVDTLDL